MPDTNARFRPQITDDSYVPSRGELRQFLRIDEDNLDQCLIEQPDCYDKVGKGVVKANYEREALKLRLEETTVSLDRDLRARLNRGGERYTEASIQNTLKDLPKIQELQRKLLAAKREADEWAVLRDAFSQRSFMLRELVAIQLARLNNLGVERGSVGARRRVGDQVREQQEASRRASYQRGDREY